jgi:transcriptional regulator with XRE-family HTH domain
VRGIGDRLTIGERIAFYRARRGLTETELANLVGRGPDWLSKIERGERPLRNVEILAELARVLRVTPGDLLGQPFPPHFVARDEFAAGSRDAATVDVDTFRADQAIAADQGLLDRYEQ